jgi:hypothetical protein
VKRHCRHRKDKQRADIRCRHGSVFYTDTAQTRRLQDRLRHLSLDTRYFPRGVSL